MVCFKRQYGLEMVSYAMPGSDFSFDVLRCRGESQICRRAFGAAKKSTSPRNYYWSCLLCVSVFAASAAFRAIAESSPQMWCLASRRIPLQPPSKNDSKVKDNFCFFLHGRSTFAYDTARKRHPTILTNAIDHMSRRLATITDPQERVCCTKWHGCSALYTPRRTHVLFI